MILRAISVKKPKKKREGIKKIDIQKVVGAVRGVDYRLYVPEEMPKFPTVDTTTAKVSFKKGTDFLTENAEKGRKILNDGKQNLKNLLGTLGMKMEG